MSKKGREKRIMSQTFTDMYWVWKNPQYVMEELPSYKCI